ncbi:helix-turn-helix domain-containing protein [Hymenobacter baengnokdamensis]|uniref:helix-turn-helix domain-containing protein n=1 Tax=Hymenobacter baengnokdamensis TaxID=2615203 RepID=UPI0012442CBB|nr:helix-turn-helix transcriptional regulator [Hymenobacter baengnokdamensis]
MLFVFGPRSSLLLPFVVPGLVAAGWLLLRAGRRGTPADALLALLIGLPTLTIMQWMLGFAGWYDSHDGYSTAMFYVPWQLNLLLGPAYYLYFRSLTNQDFRLRPRAWWHFLPGLVKISLFAAAAAYDLLWLHGVRGQELPYHFGTKGPAAALLDGLAQPVAYVVYVMLPAYGWLVLADYRRYRRYLNDNFSDAERLRFAGLRQLLLLQALSLGLSLLFEVLDVIFNFGYTEAWNYFALRGMLIYALIAVGVQANYAAATSPLRFEPGATPAEALAAEEGPAEITVAQPQASAAAPDPAALPPELLPWRDKLLALMADEQPWLEPELTLTELAQRLRTNPNVLSKVINAGCGQNFNDFVNTYRVQEASRKLADPRFAHYSLVGVALESGFNSKSTFNRVFKKLLGQAPSEVVRPKS